MIETDSSKPTGRQSTPAPTPTPSLPAHAQISTESNGDDAEPDSALAAQAQALSEQVESLSRLLAEETMAEISRHQWVDLRAIKSVRYQPGRYVITQPETEEPEAQVRLLWEPGQLLLSSSLRSTEEDQVTLTLPGVREDIVWEIPAPRPGLIPSPPSDLGRPLPLSTTSASPDWRGANNAHRQAWTRHCRPQHQGAENIQSLDQAAAAADEATVAYGMLAEIQTRRKAPETTPGATIAAAGEETAAPLRKQASLALWGEPDDGSAGS